MKIISTDFFINEIVKGLYLYVVCLLFIAMNTDVPVSNIKIIFSVLNPEAILTRVISFLYKYNKKKAGMGLEISRKSEIG